MRRINLKPKDNSLIILKSFLGLRVAKVQFDSVWSSFWSNARLDQETVHPFHRTPNRMQLNAFKRSVRIHRAFERIQT